jgi:hypothetical protein
MECGGSLKGGIMQENKEKWMKLCEEAADEQDPEKLVALILQINVLLEAKEWRLKGKTPNVRPPTERADDASPIPRKL